MAYKDILVYLDPTPASEDRLRVAVDLAKTHGARLVGVDASTEEAFLGAWGKSAVEIGSRFDEAVRAAGVVGKFVGDGDRATGPTPDYTHFVDLIIAPRPEAEARNLIRSFVPDQVLLHAGAPMLVMSQEWRPGPIGKNIVIAWNGSREAIRSVHDALPLLKGADKVVIFVFSSKGHDLRASAEMLRDHLLHHEVTSIVSDWTNTGDMTAIEALFASLDTQDSDLIVAGAFGHSRAFESLFGGVSLDLLEQPSLPIFMSH
jgi:nucleotide-binding universal stress UspA family protein